MTTESLQLIQALKHLQLGLPPAADSGFFGADIPIEQAQIVILPVGFDATTSYRSGTARTPKAMRMASHQLDLFDPLLGRPYLSGIAAVDDSSYLEAVERLNDRARLHAERVLHALDSGLPPDTFDLKVVNDCSMALNQRVYERSKFHLNQGQFVGVLGGDHATPFGLLHALAERETAFGILHIDAHHDLRQAYEGFEHSHASIMYNALQSFPSLKKLVSLGIRDFSEEEYQRAANDPRVVSVYDAHLRRQEQEGLSFWGLLQVPLSRLPQRVYVSFDIDGLEPSLCPGTGDSSAGWLSIF